jgi:hypothetical protein
VIRRARGHPDSRRTSASASTGVGSPGAAGITASVPCSSVAAAIRVRPCIRSRAIASRLRAISAAGSARRKSSTSASAIRSTVVSRTARTVPVRASPVRTPISPTGSSRPT